ncbi:hypothetical protein ABZX62_34260 [Streptomyces flavidovirens]|uniref:hypothetical protein n=1 Tax=Streptomyces flavidovirens TaxID=67298 RepID=UPI0033B6B1C7
MLTAILGVAGAVIAAVIGAWAVLRARRQSEAELELVDVSVVDQSGGVALDLKLRNIGSRSAVLKRLHIHVQQAVRLASRPVPVSGLRSSETYDVDLPAPESASGALVAKDLSQMIAPGEADRFLVQLHADGREGSRFVYRVRLELIYNADDRQVISRSLAFSCPDARICMDTPADLHVHMHDSPSRAHSVFDALERDYLLLVDILTQAEVMPPHLRNVLENAQASLRVLPVLRERLPPWPGW